MPRSVILRKATADDAGLILSLVRELALYEKEPDAVVAREEDFVRDGFGPKPKFHVLIAEERGTAVGFAFYFFGYSTWQGRPVLKLEDLFVRPEARKNGAGRALMERLAQIALEEGCTRFEWQVLDWNTPAKEFYARLGAKVLPEWEQVRMVDPSLSLLAGC
jgi:GNAT superfamily N-acetyltransferase